MGVYIKKLQAKKVEAIFTMLGLHIEDGDIIEVKAPHGRLIYADDVVEHTAVNGEDREFIRKLADYIDDADAIIEAEGE